MICVSGFDKSALAEMYALPASQHAPCVLLKAYVSKLNTIKAKLLFYAQSSFRYTLGVTPICFLK